ncbi:MAG: ATP-binding protein [Anaerolineae bacterium]|nr:ATP-binding protein [Candidatus Roseilinea sp.]MDW8448604.1 ATP-binding protein [Anaerolineae bacterium]
MWYLLIAARRKDPEFKTSAEDLFLSTARLLILAVMLAYCAGHVVATQVWPERFGGALWFVAFCILPASGLALWLSRRRMLASSVVWLLGLAASITVALYVFRDGDAAFLYAFLPLLAVVMIGAPAALPAGLLTAGLVIWTAHWPGMPALSPTQQWLAILSGGMGALIGWASSSALTTTTEWSLRHFMEARDALQETQRHRAQLADMVKSLDQAYYRLERANTALVAARKQAEDAERAKTEFIANISHELRTPLNLIVGFSEVMLTAPESYEGVALPSAYRSDLSAIYQAAQHLLALVDDILDMSRIEAGKLSLVREQTDPAALIEEAANTIRDYVNLKGLRLCVDVAPNLPPVWVDRLRIRQVILNLLVNAARFTDRGQITIRCSMAGEDGQVAGGAILISVSDTGRGIPEHDLPRIFEAFHTTEQPVSAWHSGAGLGLPISRQFVELHGGTMGVTSVVGKGSTFWFTLPCAQATPAAAQPARYHPHVPLEHTERLIVVVNEDARVSEAIQRHLGSYRVLHATSLDAGVKLAAEVKAIALLVDRDMPIPRTPPGTFVVQCPLPNQREIAHALGVHDFLAKPILRQDLSQALERLPATPRTVLIVDDDPKMVRLLQRMLRTQAGVREVIAAHTGAEALAQLESHAVDLVLLDLVMPDMDGLQVLQRMAERGCADIPVVVISGHAEDHAGLPLPGALTIHHAAGFYLGELMRAVEAALRALAPGWDKLDAATPRPPAPATTAPASRVSSDTPPLPVAPPVPAGA